MNWPHVHLILNHFPIEGSIVVLLVLLHGIARKNREVIRLGLLLSVFIALMTIAVFLTGDPAAHLLRHLPDVQKKFIGRHDHFASDSFSVMEVFGAICLGGLWLFRNDDVYPGWFVDAVVVLSLVVIGMMSWTAYLGGQIRHTEIRPGFQFPAPISSPGAAPVNPQ